MTTLPPLQHPYWHVRSVIQKNSCTVKSIELSYYEYIPQSLIDTRKVFSVLTSDFLNEDTILKIINDCPDGYELAIHSKITTTINEELHIPMIDMSTGSAAQLSKLKPFLENDFDHFIWYKSGRSYHGYGSTLISHQEWISMMGKLLLANQIGMPPTVDPRWVGHRLISGYAALRWTKNTSHYIDIPKLLTPSNKTI